MIVAQASTNFVFRNAGENISFVEFTPDPRLDGARGLFGESLRFFKPKSPLREGSYNSAFGTFTVIDSEDIDRISSKEFTADISLVIDDESVSYDLSFSEVGPCGGAFESSFLEVQNNSFLTITVERSAVEKAGNYYLFRFTAEDGTEFKRIFASHQNTPEQSYSFFRSIPESGVLSSQKLCVVVSYVSAEGEVDPELELGCVDPNDPEDPRVTNLNESAMGCSATTPEGNLSMFFLLGFVFVLSRRKTLSRKKNFT